MEPLVTREEYRISITIEVDRQSVEDQAGTLVDAFAEAHPETGPVVSGDLPSGSLTVTFALDAADEEEAFHSGQRVYLDGIRAWGRTRPRVTTVNIELVSPEELREFEPV
jgi:hypothetical protein